jgi:hypothetical protein
MQLPIVISDDYAAFKCLCEPRIFGKDYNEYLAKVCARRDALQALGVDVEFVPISPREFWTYFTDKKPATWPDLLRYAHQLHSESSSQKTGATFHH